jgi:photosystem II protein
MNLEIEFLKKNKEIFFPLIRLTKSKNGKTGTVTFFFNPIIFEPLKSNISEITGVYFILNNKKFFTQDITIYFKNGKPFIIKCIIIFKNPLEWFDFLIYFQKEKIYI